MADGPKNRKEIARHGERGRWVKVFTDAKAKLVRVQWKVAGSKMQTKSYDGPDAKARAKAFAKGVADKLQMGVVPRAQQLTMQQMWDAFVEAEFPHLRPNTQRIYTESYRTWCVRFGWGFVAELTTPGMAADMRKDLTALEWEVNSIKKVIYDVKHVFSWAESLELIQKNKLRLYRFKVGKDNKPVPPAEYRGDDFVKILAALDPSSAKEWRPFVALTLCGVQGARQWAVLHLTWEDVTRTEITWRAKWDKMGNEWTQPLRPQAAAALLLAGAWRDKKGYTGPWVIPPGSKKNAAGEPYTAQSLWSALQKAEKRAGIPKAKGRGAHGLRRMLAGDISAITKDPLMGLRSIGDTDVRMLERYVQNRPDEMRAAFDKLDSKETE